MPTAGNIIKNFARDLTSKSFSHVLAFYTKQCKRNSSTPKEDNLTTTAAIVVDLYDSVVGDADIGDHYADNVTEYK